MTDTADVPMGDATQRPEPGDPGEPNDPGDEPTEPAGPLEACAYAADDCLIGVDPADGPAQARCLDTDAECRRRLETYMDCLEELIACVGPAEASYDEAALEVCAETFNQCAEASR